jgi:hypothetical protein
MLERALEQRPVDNRRNPFRVFLQFITFFPHFVVFSVGVETSAPNGIGDKLNGWANVFTMLLRMRQACVHLALTKKVMCFNIASLFMLVFAGYRYGRV